MPTWNDEITRRLRPLRLDPATEIEIVQEISAHLADRYAALRADGVDEPHAYAAALEELRDDAVFRRELGHSQRRATEPAVAGAPADGGLVPALVRDLRWAWRNVRSRGWQPALAVALLALAMAANTLMFAAADSLVFSRTPYRDASRLVELQQLEFKTRQPGSSFLTPALVDEWRRQTDLVSAVEGHLNKIIFLTGAGEPAMVPAADITIGLVDLLGTRPRWGRTFVDEDARLQDPQAVLIAESLARERFGDPAAAVGQRMDTTAAPLLVVGVMPEAFRYPSGRERIWRALDPRGPLAAGSVGISGIARLAAATNVTHVTPLLEERSVAVGRASGAGSGYAARPTPLSSTRPTDEQRRLLLVLLGAAVCVLLIACANVASLELASAVTRARTYAIQLAIGASRASLMRSVFMEGMLLTSIATLLAGAISNLGVEVLVPYLPPALGASSANPINIDQRALLYMAGIAALTLVFSTLPVVAFAGRAHLMDLLKSEGTALATSRGGYVLRRVLTVAQVAAAVLLLVGTVLYVRTYWALLRLDKGFDSGGVIALTLTIPPQALGTAAERRVLADTLVARIRARPGVVAAFAGAPPPSTGDSPTLVREIEVDDRPPATTDLLLPKLYVEPDYFAVLRVPVVGGRVFAPGEPATNVMISTALAARLWPGQDAVGHRFRESPGGPWLSVIGLVGHVRLLQDGLQGPTRQFQLYFAQQPPPPPSPVPPASATRRFALPSYGFLTVTARVDSRARAGDVYAAARQVDPRNLLKLTFVDDTYADQFADRLLVSRVVGGFGLASFVIAMAGIYGLMTFLVASRTRELGIRLALGASPGDIRRMVLRSSLRLTSVGAVLGLGLALAVSTWIRSQLFGVEPWDPWALLTVTATVLVVGVAATWQPARLAARLDPTRLLKG